MDGPQWMDARSHVSSNFGSRTERFDHVSSLRGVRRQAEISEFHALGPGRYKHARQPFETESRNSKMVVGRVAGGVLSTSERKLSEPSLEFEATSPGLYELA